MATLREISRKSGVGVHSLRKLVKAGFLRAEAESDISTAIRSILAKQRPLSVAHLVELMTDESIYEDLGRYAEAASYQVTQLGEVKATAAPREICAVIDDAANNRPEAVETLAQWIFRALPANPCSHAWLACRLVWNSPENLRSEDIKRVPLALINARKLLTGCWAIRDDGKRKSTVYFRKANKFIDL